MKQKRTPTVTAPESADSVRTGVTPDRIARAALEIIDEKGLDGLSMRDLGQRLGCAHTAIYWYFRNREDLLKAVLDLAILNKEFAQPTTGTWDERAKVICGFVRSALRHPVLPVLLDRFSGRGMTPITMALCAALEEGGLKHGEAVAACRLLMRTVIGFSTERGGVKYSADDPVQLAEVLAHTRNDEEAAFVLAYLSANTDELFDAAIEIILDRIRQAKTIF